MVTTKNTLLLTLFTLSNTAMAENLCLQGEQIAFSCNVKTRIASLCVTTPFTKDTGKMQYRFGTRSNIEFQFPQTPSMLGKHFNLSSISYGGGGETHISFTKDSFEYIIYERTIKGEEDNKGARPTIFSEGILVRKGSKHFYEHRCNNKESTGVQAFVFDALSMTSFKPINLKEIKK